MRNGSVVDVEELSEGELIERMNFSQMLYCIEAYCTAKCNRSERLTTAFDRLLAHLHTLQAVNNHNG